MTAIVLLAFAIIVVHGLAKGPPPPKGVDEQYWRRTKNRPLETAFCKHRQDKRHCAICRRCDDISWETT